MKTKLKEKNTITPQTATEVPDSSISSEITPPPFVSELESGSTAVLENARHAQEQIQQYYDSLLDTTSLEARDSEVRYLSEAVRRSALNLKKAHQVTTDMNDELTARWQDIKRSKKKMLIPSAPANAVIDAAETRSNHFARGMNLYKLLLLCFIGSFFGVLIEVAWCLLTRGHMESRAGLVYGPFNLLYGVGAVALTATLYRYRNRGRWLSFLGGMAVGSVVEYLCSWVQEMIFGSRSWDYSAMPFNLNGRICLLYSLFWGILGVLWVKNIYPRMAKLILKIPNKPGKIITWVCVAFFVFNALVTCVAVFRWSQRVAGVPSSGPFFNFIDSRFPDSRMQRIFANMSF